MKFTRGLIRDQNPIDLPSGAWCHAKNVIISKRSVLSNEPGIELFGEFPNTLSPMGKYVFGLKVIVFSQSKADPTLSEIGWMDKKGNYTTIIRSKYLGFTKEFPILKVEGQINYYGEEIIAWITTVHPPRILNITKLPFEIDSDYELVDPLKINALNIFQEANVGVITVESVNSTGGSIKSGTVQFALAYSNKGLHRTNIFNPTNPIPISPATMSNFDSIQGAEPGTATSKSITIQISQPDTRFDYMHLFVVRRVGGTFFVEEVVKLPVRDGTVYTYTGSETVTDLTLEELLVDRIPYNNAKAMTQVNDRLYLANLSATATPDYQDHFLKLKVNYTSKPLSYGGMPPNGMKAPEVIFNASGFFPGEVYALYASARLKNGTVTPAYHIPGRVAATIPGTSLSEKVGINIDGSLGPGSSTAIGDFSEDYKAGARFFYQTRSTANNTNAATNMGFWENQTETYPEGFGSLTGEKVRHHKFPEAYEINQSNNRTTQLSTVGIIISGFDQFPQEIRDNIDSVEFFYAKKDIANSLIIGQDISTFDNKKIDGRIWDEFYQYFGGNWDIRYEDRNNDTNGSWSSNGQFVDNMTQLDKTRMRFNSFDVMLSKPSINPTHVTFQYGFRGPDLLSNYQNGQRVGFLVDSMIDRGNISDANERKTYLFGVSDFSGFGVTTLASSLSQVQYLKAIKSGKYVPANVTLGTEINKLGNEHYMIEFEDATNIPAISTPTLEVNYDDPRIRFFQPGAREEVYLYNLCQIRTDLFKSFTSQTLVSMGVVMKELLVPTTMYGGDTLVSEAAYMDHSMVPTIRRNASQNRYFMNDEYYRGEDAAYQGIKIARRFTGYFRGNPGYRHINEGIGNSAFYSSASNINSLFEDFRRDQPEQLLYNSDYSFKNELISVFPYDPEQEDAEHFPTRIIRSPLQGREVTDIQWNGFLPGDYYEHQKNRGEITNLEADNDRLFIHCRFGLFITRSSDTLKGNETNVEISSGDIFALPPREIITSDSGYAGLHSSFAAKKCKLGYIFADIEQGKVFIVNEGIDEISAYGLRNEFIDHLPMKFWEQTSMEVDHPYQQFGILIEFDERFNRVLLIKKDLVLTEPQNMGDPSVPPVFNRYYFNNGKLKKFNGANYVDLEPEEFTDKSFTLSYYHGSPGIWLAYHDYTPDIILNSRSGLFSYKGDQFFTHNSPERSFYGEPYRSFVDFVFAEPNTLTKSLANITWQSEVVDGSLSEQRNTFDSAIVFNSYQCSGEIDLSGKISYVENEWRFNKFMDIVYDRNQPFMIDREIVNGNIDPSMPYFRQRKFIDKYFIVRLYYNNSLSKDIYIYDVTANARPSTQ